MRHHECTKCQNRFQITAKVRVWNLPSHLLNPFHGPKTQLRLFSYVRCPRCGQEEYDPSIKFLGIFPPVAILWLLLAVLLLAVVEAIRDYSR